MVSESFSTMKVVLSCQRRLGTKFGMTLALRITPKTVPGAETSTERTPFGNCDQYDGDGGVIPKRRCSISLLMSKVRAAKLRCALAMVRAPVSFWKACEPA